jgi:hypothetical protein
VRNCVGESRAIQLLCLNFLLFIMRISREAWIHYPSASEPTGRIDLACRVPLEREFILRKSAMLGPRLITSPMGFTSQRHFLQPASSRTPSTLSIREIFFKSCQEASSRLAWGGSASFPSPCGLIRKPHERDENDDDDSDDGNDGESCLRRRQLFVGYYSQRAREKVQWPLLLRPMQNR